MTALTVKNTPKNNRTLPMMAEQKRQRAEVAVNTLFDELKGIYPAWKAAFETAEDFENARRIWLETLIEQRITPKMVNAGLAKAKLDTSPFMPSVGQFITWCKAESAEEYQALGLPSEDEAMKRFKSYMGFHKHDEVNFHYRSKAEYWFFKETYKRCGMRDEKHLAAELPKVLREAADKVLAGFDFPDIPKFIHHVPVIDPVKFAAGIAKCKAVLSGRAEGWNG